MKNPNKKIRTAFVNAIESTGIPTWAKVVPKDTKPIPKTYALISSQTKQRTAVDKDGFEWSCSIVVDLYHVYDAGYANPDVLDDMEEKVLNKINDDLPVADFIVKEMSLFDSRDLDSVTTTATISRRILTYEMWLNNAD